MKGEAWTVCRGKTPAKRKEETIRKKHPVGRRMTYLGEMRKKKSQGVIPHDYRDDFPQGLLGSSGEANSSGLVKRRVLFRPAGEDNAEESVLECAKGGNMHRTRG